MDVRDRFELLGHAGSGGGGDVWRARDTRTGALVALKRISATSVQATEATALAAAGTHPGLPRLIDSFTHDGVLHVVTEWIEGPNLADVLAAHGPQPFGDVVRWLRDVADALEHLHACSPPLIHRDVKPANVVIGGDGRAVLVDLGAALAAGRTGTTLAPEIAAGGDATPATDVYLLASTAFELLEAEAPSPGATAALPTVPRALRSSVLSALGAGLAAHPRHRPATAAAFVAALAPPVPTNLPLPGSSFVGRGRESAILAEALAPGRITTVVGPGGGGKSRLAIEAARATLPAWPAGVWVVPLDRAAEAGGVIGAIASSLGTPPAERAIVDALSAGPALLVLDACETVRGALVPTVAGLLGSCPDLAILATSRSPVGAPGERTIDLGPLPVPEDRPGSPLEASPAVALFIDRACAADPAFVLDATTGPAVREICRRTDGMPLAIELAAAHVRTMRVTRIATELADRIDILRADDADTDRHATMGAAIAWSVGLLDEEARAVFLGLAPFVTFDPQRASEIVGRALDVPDVSAAIERVHEAGLLVRADAERRRLLEPIRAFARDALANDETVEAAVVDGFIASYQDLARSQGRAIGTEREDAAMAVLAAERPNLYVTLDLLLARGGAAAAASIMDDLQRFVYREGGLAMLQPLVDRCLSLLTDDHVRERAVLTMLRAVCLIDAGRLEEGMQAVDEAERLREASGDRRPAPDASLHRGYAAMILGRFDEGRGHLRTGIAAAEHRGQRDTQAQLIANLATLELIAGRVEESIELHERCLSLYRELGNRTGMVAVLTTLAQAVDDPARSRAVATEALEGARAIGDVRNEAFSLQQLGLLDLAEGDRLMALARQKQGVELHWQRRDVDSVTKGLYYIARALAPDDPDAAVTLLACHAAVRTARGLPVMTEGEPEYRELVDGLRGALGATFEDAERRGYGMSLPDAVALALGA